MGVGTWRAHITVVQDDVGIIWMLCGHEEDAHPKNRAMMTMMQEVGCVARTVLAPELGPIAYPAMSTAWVVVV